MRTASTVAAARASALWARHRIALAGALGRLSAEALVEPLCAPGGDRFFGFLTVHGLSSFWAQELTARACISQLPGGLAQCLKAQTQADAAQYLLQSHALRGVSDTFDRAGIVHAVLKGCAVREMLHRPPHLRSATDIDVLVRPDQRREAAQLLAGLGYYCIDEGASAHEQTWKRGRVDIDLHWDILAPGRTRAPVTEALLARRVRGPSGWRLCDADTVAFMLLHPAVTKYVCSPHVGLNRVVDFVCFVRAQDIDWTEVGDRVRETGLAPAAWAMARWLQHLGAWPEGEGAARALAHWAPAHWRRAWLALWVDRDWPGRLTGHHDAWVALGFTLVFHETSRDLLAALRGRLARGR